MPDQIYSVKWNDVSKKNYTYDGLGRVTSQTVYPSVGVSLDNTYAYKDVGENNTTTQVSRLTNALGTYDYEYDVNGNITKITFTAPTGSSGSYVREYQYDHLNRITSTYDSKYGYRHEYEYDTNGNIISRNRYYNNGIEPDRIYTYDYDDTVWTDLLTAFCGDEITYDEIGNPLDYYNNTVFTWQNGRQLASITKHGKTTTYAYDANGQRISKTVDGVTTEFFYAGDILAGQKTGDNILMWIYDNNGAYIGFTYNGVEYYYVYNLQGDVEAITDASGAIVAKYGYDTWGEVQYEANYNGTVNIAQINPIRYRGYYYDSERGLYYLNSRYYDPFMCRFLNADGYVTTGQGVTSFNMFAYCGNNPVNRADPTGQSWIVALLGAVCVVALTSCKKTAPKAQKDEPYKTADDAARAFSEQVYSSSVYIRHEYSTDIYSRTVNGKTTYNYTSPRVGTPHTAPVGRPTPEGTKIVAYAHTHPVTSSFSALDIQSAKDFEIDGYLVGPTLKLQKYSLSSKSTTDLGSISPIALTDAQRSSLVTEFQASWDAHVSTGCILCSGMKWPTP